MSSKFIYGLVIFSSAFLLFQVQPLLGKIILPWFGGAAGVWIVCLLFFQVVLLLGYFYAHLLTRKFSPRTQVRIHAALLAASLLLLPIVPKDSWKPSTPFRSGIAYTFVVGRHGGPALLSSVLHQPAVASLVRTKRRGHSSLPLLRRLQHRLDAGVNKLPHPGGALVCHLASSGGMVVGIRAASPFCVRLVALFSPRQDICGGRLEGTPRARLGRCRLCGSAWRRAAQRFCLPSPTTSRKTSLPFRCFG